MEEKEREDNAEEEEEEEDKRRERKRKEQKEEETMKIYESTYGYKHSTQRTTRTDKYDDTTFA